MIRALELNCVRLGGEIAAVLSERDLFRKKLAEQFGIDPDVSERIAALHRWQKDKETVVYTDAGALRAVARTSKQLVRLMTRSSADTAGFVNPGMISRLLLAAYPDRTCKQREDRTERFVIAQGRGVRIASGSHLVNSLYIIAPVVDLGEKSEGFVHIAAPATEELIRSGCSDQISVQSKKAHAVYERGVLRSRRPRNNCASVS